MLHDQTPQGWVQRRAAAAIFASPPTSSYEEALGYFRRAEEADPGFYLNNQFLLGKCYLRMGDKTNARVWFSKALAMPIIDAEGTKDSAEAATLMKQCC